MAKKHNGYLWLKILGALVSLIIAVGTIYGFVDHKVGTAILNHEGRVHPGSVLYREFKNVIKNIDEDLDDIKEKLEDIENRLD